EAEGGGIADAADVAAAVERADAVGGVFHHLQVVAAGDVHDLVHGAGFAAEVDRDDRLRARGDGALDGFRIDVEVPFADINEDGRGAAMDDDGGRGGEGVDRGDDFIAVADAPGREAEVHGGGAGI